jgi:hypothetical protein
MVEDAFRKDAECHWEFLRPLKFYTVIINGVRMYDEATVKYLYVEALIHGHKHGVEETVCKQSTK